ncbi:hypothetical protein SPI_02331 [Niveomyces insectorum RCEF 264]|uniref:Uncharacterized protein n=1 Tax=Niveomyces insectorum RCEF 264 TaxID=1081102 RepID=A0A167XXM3_9HYPO|nr:hypothetical protein SPI_02331 [Niveomyces insectorum RCEF 264]
MQPRMIKAVESERFTPTRFYLEFDLAIKLHVSDSENASQGCLTPTSTAEQAYDARFEANYDRAKTALLLSFGEIGIPMIDNDVDNTLEDYVTYLGRVLEHFPSMVASQMPGEIITDRFWLVMHSPTPHVCPPPVDVPAQDDEGAHSVDDLQYPSGDPDEPEREKTNPVGGCTWLDVHYVLQYLHFWCQDGHNERFTIVSSPLDGAGGVNETNTALRILLVRTHGPFKTRQPGEDSTMSLLQTKKMALFMFFFENHLRLLCHPRQSRVRPRPPSQLTASWPPGMTWNVYGPLSRRLWAYSQAAIDGQRQQEPIPGDVLRDLLQYAPRTMLDRHMREYKKLALVWGAVDESALAAQLRIADARLPHDNNNGDDDGYNDDDDDYNDPRRGGPIPSVKWPVLGVYSHDSYDVMGFPITVPILALGGFQAVPFNACFVWLAARLAMDCVRTSRLPPAAFQKLLTRIERASQWHTLPLLVLLGSDPKAWEAVRDHYAVDVT